VSVNDHDFEDTIHSQSDDVQAAADAVHDFHCTSAVAPEQRIIGIVDQFCHRQVIGRTERIPRRMTASRRSLSAAVQKPYQALAA